jgi:raffinose/stachyose/melibiose transport system permease protein
MRTQPGTPAASAGDAATSTAATTVRGTARLRRQRRSRLVHPALYLFPLPALALYVFFFAIPALQAVQYAVTDWDGFSAEYNFVGLDNFRTALTADDLFRNAVVNNLKFMLVVVIAQTLLSLLFAIFLTKNTRSSIALRALFFFPTILASVSVAFIWKFIYDPNFGLINQTLDAVGLEGLKSPFLGDDAKAIFFVAITQVWFHVGQMMVVYVAGLQQVPQELYESARVDGASRWHEFRYVTWPMVAPATAIVLAYTMIQAFKAFDLILGLGGNPPKASLDILSTRIYTTFANSQFGYAAAESILFMILIVLVTWLQRRTVRLTQGGA